MVLQGRIVRFKARIAAQDLLGGVETDLRTKLDDDFHKALAAPVNALKTALNNNDTAAISKATTDLDTAWRTQLQSLAASLTSESVEVEHLASLVGPSEEESRKDPGKKLSIKFATQGLTIANWTIAPSAVISRDSSDPPLAATLKCYLSVLAHIRSDRLCSLRSRCRRRHHKK